MKKHLIVGLGNIGEKYEETRHNIGFKIVDEISKKQNASWANDNFGSISKFSYKGRPVYLLKPNTFMNLSGNAVLFWKKKLNIDNTEILIITDDIHIPYPTLRMKPKGSHGGHNGLRNIEEKLQSTQYPRLRFGIGKDFTEGKQVDYVLENWSDQELETFASHINTFAEASLSFVFAGINNTMNKFNGK